jgi:hypothetical protein
MRRAGGQVPSRGRLLRLLLLLLQLWRRGLCRGLPLRLLAAWVARGLQLLLEQLDLRSRGLRRQTDSVARLRRCAQRRAGRRAPPARAARAPRAAAARSSRAAPFRRPALRSATQHAGSVGARTCSFCAACMSRCVRAFRVASASADRSAETTLACRSSTCARSSAHGERTRTCKRRTPAPSTEGPEGHTCFFSSSACREASASLARSRSVPSVSFARSTHGPSAEPRSRCGPLPQTTHLLELLAQLAVELHDALDLQLLHASAALRSRVLGGRRVLLHPRDSLRARARTAERASARRPERRPTPTGANLLEPPVLLHEVHVLLAGPAVLAQPLRLALQLLDDAARCVRRRAHGRAPRCIGASRTAAWLRPWPSGHGRRGRECSAQPIPRARSAPTTARRAPRTHSAQRL